MFMAIFRLSPPDKDEEIFRNVKYSNFKANILRLFVLNYD